MNNILSSLELLSPRYPALLRISDLSVITCESQQTIRNKICMGIYPIPSSTIGRRRVFKLIDVAAYIDNLSTLSPCKTLRGRPTKASQSRLTLLVKQHAKDCQDDK